MSLYNYGDFINEVKTYQVYKGVRSDKMELILEDNKIKNNGMFNSILRQNVIGKSGAISCSRSFNVAKEYGDFVFQFNMVRLSSNFKIIPFCENPDYYLKMKKRLQDSGQHVYLFSNSNKWTYKELRNKKYGKDYWDVKTNKNSSDFGICEELIVADEIDITKYVSKIYQCPIKYPDINLINSTKRLCEKYNIEYIVLD